jgi:hypothetical protein
MPQLDSGLRRNDETSWRCHLAAACSRGGAIGSGGLDFLTPFQCGVERAWKGCDVCYFLALGVDARIADQIASDQKWRRQLAVWPASNASIAALFPKRDRLFWVTHGGCSCDLGLARSDRDAELERDRRKYLAKGWSEAKISRALAAKHDERKPLLRGQREDTPREVLSDLLRDLVDRDGGARLFLHFFGGSQDAEHVAGGRTARLSITDFANGATVPEDALVEMTN